jgi:hypothetical protein
METSLEIFRLNRRGEVSRRINCLPGRVTVFRGHESDRTAYENALLGRAQEGEFSVLLGQTPIEKTACNQIGIGPDFAPEYLGTVYEYLQQHGLAPKDSERILLNLSLGGLGNRRCTELTAEQQRILRLLALETQPQMVHILSDPFRGLSESRREDFAARLVQFVAKAKGLVILTQLSDRPATWIENEYISRVQLERPRSATIGFGSDSLRREDLLKGMEAETKQGLSAALQQPKTSSHVPLLSGLLLATIVLATFMTLLKHPDLLSRVEPAKVNENMVLAPIAEPEDEETSEQYFPSDVVKSIQAAFLTPDQLISGSIANIQPQSSAAPQVVARVASSNLASTMQQDSLEENTDIDARREEIRRRFLEAIQRAANTNEDSGMGFAQE